MVVQQTQSLLTKIVKLCSEIRDIKKGNKLNIIAVKLSKSNSVDERTGTPPPQQDTGGMGDLHDTGYEDSSPNYQSHLSCKTYTPQDNAQSPDHTLSPLTPELLRSSHTSPPPSEASTKSPSSLSASDPEVYKSVTSNGDTSSEPLVAVTEAGVTGSNGGMGEDDPDPDIVGDSALGL